MPRNSTRYAVDVTRATTGERLRRLDGLGALTDRRRAARLFYYWLTDNGHTSRVAAVAAANDLDRNGSTTVVLRAGDPVHATLEELS